MKQKTQQTTAKTILEVRPGNGGEDAEAFAQELCTALSKALQRANQEVDVQPASAAARGFVISTDASLGLVSWLQGTHVVQRIPKGSAARHTSSATVVAYNESGNIHFEPVTANDPSLRIERYRGSGPGGQHRNKVSTAIRIVHQPSGIVVTRESGRSQSANLESALAQLNETLRSRAQNRVQASVNAQRAVLRPEHNPTNQKDFTHNEQRGEVVDHRRSKRFTLKNWQAGKIPLR